MGSAFSCCHELIDFGLRFVRHHRLAELEVALVFAQDDFVDQSPGRALDRFGANVHRIGGRTGVIGTLGGRA